VQATLNNIWDAANRKAAAPVVAAAPEPKAEEAEVEKPAAGSLKVSAEKPAKKGLKVFVKCPRCKAKNPPEGNYCVKCGQEL
jgi:ribosomal protein L40E